MGVQYSQLQALEQAFIDRLKAVQIDGRDAFKTVESWRHQILPGSLSAGLESFARLTPFAFVTADFDTAARLGDYDLNQVVTVQVAVGQSARHNGAAKFGDGDTVGAITLAQHVFDCFEGFHPGGAFSCDDFYWQRDILNVDQPKHYALNLVFMANNVNA